MTSVSQHHPTAKVFTHEDVLDEYKPSDTIDANGVRTIIEYTTNDNGKKVKVRLCHERLPITPQLLTTLLCV